MALLWLLVGFAAVVSADCTYGVVPGDNCWAIATSKFGITLPELYRLNPGIKDTSCPIYPGDQLVVPCTEPKRLVVPRLDGVCTETYDVQPGDYGYKISVEKSVSIQNLMQWNSLEPPYMLWPGNSLCISKLEPVKCVSWHTVEPGDTCYALAQRARLSLDKLIKLNPNLMSYQCPLLAGQRVCLKEMAMGKRYAPKSREPLVLPSAEPEIVAVMNNFVGNWTDSTLPSGATLMPSAQELYAAIQVVVKGDPVSPTTKNKLGTRTELGVTLDLAGVLQSTLIMWELMGLNIKDGH